MIAANVRLQKIGQASGWRRLFIACTVLLAPAAVAWTWIGPGRGWVFSEQIEYVLVIWSIGAAGLGLLLGLLSALDRGLAWIGAGFGLAPGRARLGLAAVLAGLTFLGALAQFLRYEIVMPEGAAMRTGELCVVLDRWTGEAKPCTQEAVVKRRRIPPQPQRVEDPPREESAWREIVSIVLELMKAEKWLPGMIGKV